MGRPVEQRYDGQAGQYDYEGNARIRMVCRFPIPDDSIVFSNGKTIRKFPLVVVNSPNPKGAECKFTEGTAIEGSIGMTVNTEMCDLQRALDECPRGLRLEGF